MKPKDIDLFFEKLSQKWPTAVRIILIGGASSLLMGGERPTMDIDFELKLNHVEYPDRENFQKIIEELSKITGINAQFSENIERWSEISLVDYRDHLKFYKKFKNISVYTLEAGYWSIGKISRYWDQDIQDMIAVFKHEAIAPLKILTLWTTALSQSPLSSQLSSTKKHISHFFNTFGRKIWGKNYPKEKILTKLKE